MNLTKPVLIVVKEIAPWEMFTPQNVKSLPIPVNCVLTNALTDFNDINGMYSSIRLFPGEQIIKERIDEGCIYANNNERYIYVPIKEVQLRPGELVDIYLIYKTGITKYHGVEKIFAGKRVATVLDERGRGLINSKESLELEKRQCGVEILATEEEIGQYLEKKQYAQQILVRFGKRRG